KQTVEDAIEQYKRDRDPKELLFQFGRCVFHFAVDDHEVRMCTHLKGKASWFLPFNKGWNERAVIELLSDHTELFKQFSDNPSFKKWLSETIFTATYADAS
ncbi:MAG: hypothetical protein GXX86_03260, partial [Propionibacterium sp.]|nr:hypothetical protein [Propionibacterium sp.]